MLNLTTFNTLVPEPQNWLSRSSLSLLSSFFAPFSHDQSRHWDSQRYTIWFYFPIYIHTYIYTCMHAYIHTYKHIHTLLQFRKRQKACYSYPMESGYHPQIAYDPKRRKFWSSNPVQELHSLLTDCTRGSFIFAHNPCPNSSSHCRVPSHTRPSLPSFLPVVRPNVGNLWKLEEVLQSSSHLKQGGLCHTVALPFTLFKRILRQKKNYGNSNISPCRNNIIFKTIL
jgi:hypothetical protein